MPENNDKAVLQSGEQGAAAGSAAGPWGAVIGGAAGVISGLLNSGRDIPQEDLAAIFSTIAQSGQQKQSLINQLPESLKPLYANYEASNAAASNALQTGTQALGQSLEQKAGAVYSPTSPAVQAALDALKTQTYSTVPTSQAAIRESLAATGGLDRGSAIRALAAPTIQAAGTYAQGAANITADQLAKQQAATLQAINTVNSMDNNVLQQQFGLSKDQALNILQYGRQDQKDQLTQLLSTIDTSTNQALAAEGLQAANSYNTAVANNAQQAALTNSLVGLGATAVNSGVQYANNNGSTGLPAGADVTSYDYQRNNIANAPPQIRYI